MLAHPAELLQCEFSFIQKNFVLNRETRFSQSWLVLALDLHTRWSSFGIDFKNSLTHRSASLMWAPRDSKERTTCSLVFLSFFQTLKLWSDIPHWIYRERSRQMQFKCQDLTIRGRTWDVFRRVRDNLVCGTRPESERMLKREAINHNVTLWISSINGLISQVCCNRYKCLWI